MYTEALHELTMHINEYPNECVCVCVCAAAAIIGKINNFKYFHQWPKLAIKILIGQQRHY